MPPSQENPTVAKSALKILKSVAIFSEVWRCVHRNDEEKAGGLKHAGPVALEGSSPPSSESAWSKMLSERGRDRSPEFASSNSEGISIEI
jgi:hypothetical protein